MAIDLFTGTPGSGKSYNAIRRILMALMWKKIVIANFPLKFTDKEIKKGYDKRFYYVPNEELTIEYLIDFAIGLGIDKVKEGRCLVVIDEAGGKFNCREFQKSDRLEWIDFFSQHRKLGYDFLLISQTDRMLDKQIRGFVETEYKHRKINNFMPFFLFPVEVVLKLLNISWFVSVEYWYGVKERVGSEMMFFRKSVGSHYDSHRLFQGFKLSDVLVRKIENLNYKSELNVSVNAIWQGNENE